MLTAGRRRCAAPAVAVAVAALITPRKATQDAEQNLCPTPPTRPVCDEAARLAPPPQSPPGLERARLLGLDTAEEEVLAQLELDLLARLATHVGEGDDQRASRGRELLAQGLDRQKAGEMGGFGNGALEHLKQWRGAPRGPASSWECRAARSRQARPEEAQETSWGADPDCTLTMRLHRPLGDDVVRLPGRDVGVARGDDGAAVVRLLERRRAECAARSV